MKKLKLFFALFAMLALGVGNAWAEELEVIETLNLSVSTTINATPITVGDVLSITGTKGTNNFPVFNYNSTKGVDLRFYQGTSCSVTFTAKEGYKLEQIVFKKNASTASTLSNISVNSGTLNSNVWTASESTESVTFTYNSSSNFKEQIYKIYVTYSSTSSGGTEPPTPTTQYTIKWHTAKGVTTDVTLNEGATITKPVTDPTMTGYEFMGWTASCDVASDGSDFTALTDFGIADSDKDFYAVFATATTTGGGESTPTEVTDVLNRATTGVTNTSYATWSGKTATSSAVYAGQSAGGNESIQLRSNNNNSGIVTTTSGGKATKISVEWNSNTSSGRTIDIYGKNSAYTQATDLYDSANQGTNLGNIKYGTSTELTIDGDYEYIGIRSNSGALYLTSVSITWVSEGTGGGTTTYSNYITTCASDIEFVELGDAFKWSATEAEVTIDATDNVFPTLTNTHNLPVTYSSIDETIASIAADGTVTLKKEGTVTITAKYEGGISAGTGKEYKAKTVDYTLTVKPAPLEPIAGGVIDILDNEWTELTTSDYKTVDAKTAANTGHSNAQYTAQCAGSNSSIQLRSNNSNSGIVSTVSGGLVKRVEIEWNDATSEGRTLNIYGSNIPYTNPTDLYDTSKDGDKLGTIVKGTSTYLDISKDYRYIGIRSANGAMYLAKVTITWLPINSKVSIDDAIQHGSVSVTGVADLNAVAAGTVLTLDNTPEAGYKFVKYNVYKTDEPTTEIDVENSKFTMPEYDVTVSATFTSIKELDKIEVNTTNVKKTFWQGEAFSSDGLEVTAYYTDGTSAEVTPTNITGGNTANAGEITVTVSYTEGSNTKTTTYNITVKAIENNETTVYTVAQAREIIDAVGETTVDVYVQGTVSKIVTAFNPTYGNISYDISDDGLKTSDQLQAYRGFSYEGDWFTSADDIQVGDVVVVKGKLKLYNTTYELDEGNQLVKLERSDEPKPTAASLPFYFDGNKDDIADVVGMSQTGLGSYSSSPKLKFDDENDNVIIHFDSEPGEFSFALKQNGSNAGTFTVYESANGEDYTSVWSGGNLGNGQTSTIESNLSSTARYVKFELTTRGSSTNYGLGQISIKKIDKRQDAGLAWNPATISLTVGETFTAPTLSNPNGLTGITFTSDNEALATVNNAGVISLVSGKTGTATITATFADGDATYKPAEVTCVITVSPKSEKVVILAEYNGQWYALKAAYFSTYTNRLAAIPVNYVGGKLYNVAEADKATIEWQLAMNGAKATFKNGDNYLTGTDGTDLTLSTTAFEWDYDGELYLSDGGTRTFIYHKDGYFRNYATSNAIPNSTTYSDKPVVTAPVYDTAIEIGSGDNSTVIAANQGQIVKVIVDRAFEAGDEWYTLCVPFNMQASLIGTAYQLSGLVQKGTDYVEVNLAAKNTIEAGKPYLVKPNVTVNKFVVENVTIVNTTGESIAKSIEGLSVEMQGVINGSGTTGGLYWVGNSGYLYNDDVAKLGLRTYFNITTLSGIAPRMRVVAGENVETGVEDLFTTEAPAKVIENGQLIIIRDGVKYNVQGQKL